MTKRNLQQTGIEGKEEKTTIDLLKEADELCLQLEEKVKQAIEEVKKQGGDLNTINMLTESLLQMSNNRFHLDYHRKRLEDMMGSNNNNNNNPSPKI
jgi:hypothetical protein